MKSSREVLVWRLANGVLLPAVCLGCWKLKPEEAEEAVGSALKHGYYGIDDAWIYHNEEAVGAAVQKFDGEVTGAQPEIKACGGCEVVSRDEFLANFSVPHGKPEDDRKVFVTSKIWVRAFEREAMRAQTEEHLRNFGRSSCDLMILHWPGEHEGFGSNADSKEEARERMKVLNTDEYRAATWRHLEELYAEGKCRAIGVSNYMVKHLKPLLVDIKRRKDAGDKNAIYPMYNQIEINPFFTPEPELERLCKEHQILIASYSTLGGSTDVHNTLATPEITQLAKKYNKASPASIVLRWALQRGYHVIPKSSHPDRIRLNHDVFNFNLNDDDMNTINSLTKLNKFHNLDPMDIP